MKLSNLVKSWGKDTIRGKLGPSGISAISSTPLPSLLAPLTDFYNDVLVRMRSIDAFNVGFACCDAFFEGSAADIMDGVQGVSPYALSTDQAESLVSGLKQCRDNLSDMNSPYVLNVSSSVGLSYVIQLNDNVISNSDDGDLAVFVTKYGTKPLLTRVSSSNGTSYFLSNRAFSSIYVDKSEAISGTQSPNIFSAVQRLFDYYWNQQIISVQLETISDLKVLVATLFSVDTSSFTIHDAVEYLYAEIVPEGTALNIYTMLYEIVYTLTTTPAREEKNFSEKLIAVVNSAIASAEINTFILSCIDSIRSARISAFFSNVGEAISSKIDAVRKLFARAKDAWGQGGIKGLIYFIYSIIKAGSSIVDDNGVMRFTDNSSLIPKEYIAGMIATLLSAVGAVVSVIASIFQPIVGAITMAVSGILTGIVQSFSYDRQATNASVYVPTTDEDGVNVINVLPLGSFQSNETFASYDELPSWYKEQYESGFSCLSLNVVGGKCFVGPGSFDDMNLPNSLNIEFHPSAVVYDREKVNTLLGSHISSGTSNDFWFFNLLNCLGCQNGYDPDVAMNHLLSLWEELTSSCIGVSNNFTSDDGRISMSDSGDAIQANSGTLNLFLFIIYASILEGSLGAVLMDYPYCFGQNSSDGNKWRDLFANVCRWIKDVSPGRDWSKMIYVSDYINTVNGLDIRFKKTADSGADYRDLNVRSAYVEYRKTIMQGIFFDTPYTLPINLQYAVVMPRYNGRTFWTYIALAVTATIVAVAAVAIVTVSAKKFIKSKRAKNVASFASAQSDYQAAITGNKQVWNEETKKYEDVPFDVNSSEGQAYIKQCYKNYKKTAFKNNLWANLIGGSRYDVSTFYGEAEEPEDDESLLSSLLSESDSDVEAAASQSDSSPSIDVDNATWRDFRDEVYQMITGSLPS